MKNKLKSIVLLAVVSLNGLVAQTYEYPFRNPDLPLDERVQDIISRLTLEEKSSVDETCCSGSSSLRHTGL